MNLFTLMATLGLDSSNFNRGINQATQTGKNFASSTAKSVRAGTVALGNLMADAVKAAGRAVVNLGKMGIAYNAQMEDYTTNFKVMLGSQEAAVKKVNELREMAAQTPFAMEDLAAGTEMLLSFGIEADKVTGILSMLGDISLGNANKMSSLTRAFAQMSSAGKLNGEDLNQMIDAGFNPLMIMAEKTGASIGDLKEAMAGQKGSREFRNQIKAAQKEVKKFGDEASEGAKILAQIGREGEISAELVTRMFEIATEEGGLFYQGMSEAAKTLSGQWSTLQDNTQNLIGLFFEPVANYLSEKLLPWANDFIDVLTTGFQEGGFEQMFKVGIQFLLGEEELDWDAIEGGTLPEKIKTMFTGWWESSGKAEMTKAANYISETLVEPLSSTLSEAINNAISSAVEEVPSTLLKKFIQNLHILGDVFSGRITPDWEEVGQIKLWTPDEGTSSSEREHRGGLASFIIPMLSPESEETLQGELDGMDLEGQTLLEADPQSAGNLQSWLDSQTFTAVVDFISSDSGIGGLGGGMTNRTYHKKAVGIDYVPYDNFPALLHEGEKVLTKLEANRERSGQGINVDYPSGSHTINQYISAVPQTAQEFADEMRWALEMQRFSV